MPVTMLKLMPKEEVAIRQEMDALITRAIAHGRKLERDAIAERLGLGPAAATNAAAAKAASEKPDFGAISNTVRSIFHQNRAPLSMQLIFRLARKEKPELNDQQLRSSIKVLAKMGELSAVSRGIYRATDKLKGAA